MGQNEMIELGARVGIYFVPFLFALCFHEFAHGLVAKFRGDNTAEQAGRLSLNPIVHADPIGTWMLPIMALLFNSPFFFGWAKPVPVDSRNLKHPKNDMFWIALAGPLSNIFLALVSCVVLGVVFAFRNQIGFASAAIQMLQIFISVNLFLAVFNLIPIHPLDGGKVIAPFLPARWNYWLEMNQNTLNMFLLFFILILGRFLAIPVLLMMNQLLSVSEFIAQKLI